MSVRSQKATELLAHLAGEYLAREAGPQSLITVTHADLSPDRKNATIFVSVFPTEAGTQALEFLTRHKDLFREYLKSHSRMPVLPYITWELDYGELNRQRIDELSREAGL